MSLKLELLDEAQELIQGAERRLSETTAGSAGPIARDYQGLVKEAQELYDALFEERGNLREASSLLGKLRGLLEPAVSDTPDA